jgi:hypothetical protein
MDDELKRYLVALEERLAQRIEDRLAQRIEKTETSLLTAFHGWARSMEIRSRGTNVAVAGFTYEGAARDARIVADKCKLWEAYSLA